MTDQELFERFIRQHIAALTEASGKYTRRLSPQDREWFFERALNLAFARRLAFNPKRESVTQWFEKCLTSTAESRKKWLVLHVDGWREVSGKGLGRER